MSETKVNGPEDAVVSEKIKQLGENLHHHKVLPGTFHGAGRGTKFMEDRETGYLRNPDAEPKKGISSYRAIALHVRGIDGSSCQHLQVMMTQVLQKHWEWQDGRRPMMMHGSVTPPTMHLASMDIKTASDVARPKHTAKHHG